MTLETNGFTTTLAKGNREDLVDTISNISPSDTPFLTAAGTGKASAIKHEWQTVANNAPADNKQLEGNAISPAAATATVRLDNQCQIMIKTARVSGTQEEVKKAGRVSEMNFQMAMRAAELKTDIEFAMIGQLNVKVARNDTTAGEMAPVQGYIYSNDSCGAGGASPSTGDGSDSRTDGTQRAFSEDLLKDVMQLAFSSGANPNMLMVSPFNRRVVSSFTGGSTRFDKAEDKKLNATIDVYVSDFGELKVVPSRILRTRDALVLDMSLWKVCPLRNFRTGELARTGDTTARDIIWEGTLEACNEKGNGGIFDLTTS